MSRFEIDQLPRAATFNQVFELAIAQYHKTDNVDATMQSPYPGQSFEHLLYLKNWIDTVQWHLEDIVRDPEIHPEEALKIKRRIDASNQHRTDVVELIDDWFLRTFESVKPMKNAGLNTESPAWVIDRMSILCLKIFHMAEQTNRTDASDEHISKCRIKLLTLHEQQEDLSQAFDELMADFKTGRKFMKVYRQMKMYNDDQLNPALYKKNNS